MSRLADGALRDGLSLLDQCAAVGGTVDSRAVLEALGLAGNLQTAQLMEFILSRDAKGALLQLDQLYQGVCSQPRTYARICCPRASSIVFAAVVSSRPEKKSPKPAAAAEHSGRLSASVVFFIIRVKSDMLQK